MRLTDSALARYRHAAGLTATHAALVLGIHPSLLSQYESGKVGPNGARIEAMCLLYGVTVMQLNAAIRKDGLRYLAKLNRQRRPRAAS